MMTDEKSVITATGWEIKLNSGNLFKNTSDNPKAPLYSGAVNIDGSEWRLALWKSEKGYLSCKFTQDNHVGGMDFDKPVPTENLSKEPNDDIPF
jgi:hypothetical protein